MDVLEAQEVRIRDGGARSAVLREGLPATPAGSQRRRRMGRGEGGPGLGLRVVLVLMLVLVPMLLRIVVLVIIHARVLLQMVGAGEELRLVVGRARGDV